MEDNELITLEMIHHFVEILDRYFGSVRQNSYTLTDIYRTILLTLSVCPA